MHGFPSRESPFPVVHFQGQAVSFREGSLTPLIWHRQNSVSFFGFPIFHLEGNIQQVRHRKPSSMVVEMLPVKGGIGTI